MYWQDRMAKAQSALGNKNIKAIEKELKRLYGKSLKRVTEDFERTYNQVLLQQEQGKEVTPALLYRLDSYWKMQGQLRQELQKLGDKQIQALSKVFEIHFFDIYYSINIEGIEAFSTINAEIAQQIINQIWVADGKSFSQRVWDNTEKLVETLNEELIHCVVTGKKTSELKQLLQDRFNVSYNNADMLARTEIAHIQTQAAKKRYEDYGIQEVQVWAPKDERQCEICGKLHQKIYPVSATMPVPAHPRCRCAIIPIV